MQCLQEGASQRASSHARSRQLQGQVRTLRALAADASRIGSVGIHSPRFAFTTHHVSNTSCPPDPHLRSNHRGRARSEEHTSELQSQSNLVCRLLLEKKKKN